MRRFERLLVVLLGLALCAMIPGRVMAQPATAAPGAPASAVVDEARSRMEAAQRLFAEQKFAEATDTFVAAYEKHKFTAFLFNAAVAAERAERRDQAATLYRRFLDAEPGAPDKADIEATIERLKKEQASPSVEPDPAPKADIKSLVLIESEPSGAPVTIFERLTPGVPAFDLKDSVHAGYRKVMSGEKTPTDLSLKGGTYFVQVEGFADYNTTGSAFTLEPGRVYVYRASLSQGAFVGRVEISVPVSHAKIFLDDPPPHKNAPRAIGPASIELSPGPHTFWIEATGFTPLEKQVEVVQGKTVPLDAKLERVTYGYLLIRGNADEVEVEVDGEDAGIYKKKGDPLRLRLPAGEHLVEIDADGRKAYEDFLVVPRGQELRIDATLEESPGKGGAAIVALLAAGALAGGVVLNVHGSSLPDSDPDRDTFSNVSIGTFVGSGVLTGLAVFLFAFDPTDDSSAKILPVREFTGPALEEDAGPEPASVGIRIGPPPACEPTVAPATFGGLLSVGGAF